jgi:hypothetical protein
MPRKNAPTPPVVVDAPAEGVATAEAVVVAVAQEPAAAALEAVPVVPVAEVTPVAAAAAAALAEPALPKAQVAKLPKAPVRAMKAAKPAQAEAAKALKPQKAQKPEKAAKPEKPAKATKEVKAEKPAKAPKEAKAEKPVKDAEAAKDVAKPKLVRDSFTMPRGDFALIAVLKDRALGFKRPAKKSELLRAGLHALAALDDAQLQAALDELTPLKAGRPRKG